MILTWRQCAEAGMSKAEAARHRGMTTSAACMAARRLDLTFRPGRLQDARRYLTPLELVDYEVLLRKGKFLSAEALEIIGRDDLIP